MERKINIYSPLLFWVSVWMLMSDDGLSSIVLLITGLDKQVAEDWHDPVKGTFCSSRDFLDLILSARIVVKHQW